MSEQQPQVCVLTSRSMAAIGSIAIAGIGAGRVLEKIFIAGEPKTSTPLTLSPLRGTPSWQGESFISHGLIMDREQVVDEVVVGCEGPELFVIHCHGNPLLIEQVVKLAQAHGAVLTDPERFWFEQHRVESNGLIEAEAKLAMQQCATLTGVKILQAQIDSGLSVWAKQVLYNINTVDSEQIQQDCKAILDRSRIANFFIHGVRIVIAGPPNAGKSTLLNALADQQQAITSNTAGTTRDWISVVCELTLSNTTDKNSLSVRAEFFDTAGLNDVPTGVDGVDSQAQLITQQLLDSCDLTLYVQDVSTATHTSVVAQKSARPIISVYNKCDLIQKDKKLQTRKYSLQQSAIKPVYISAKHKSDINTLVETIFAVLGVKEFEYHRPVVFTDRQQTIIEQIFEGQPLQFCLEQILN